MAGRMGGERKTLNHLQVLKVVPERNLLLIEAACPGRGIPYSKSKASVEIDLDRINRINQDRVNLIHDENSNLDHPVILSDVWWFENMQETTKRVKP